MNKKQKGNKAENELANLLRGIGYTVQVAQRTSKFTGKFYISMDNDFFNLFDLLSINKNTIQLIQVKTNANHVYGAMKEIAKFADKVGNTKIDYFVVLRVNRKGWVYWRYNGYEWVKLFFDLKLKPSGAFIYS